mmetsp:Transcript_9710/g.28692  ORF Transcript_9710/g.28692 Transcript_9710/m.28692 type:complete len:220 (-) Transcript_9710:133-792(-)
MQRRWLASSIFWRVPLLVARCMIGRSTGAFTEHLRMIEPSGAHSACAIGKPWIKSSLQPSSSLSVSGTSVQSSLMFCSMRKASAAACASRAETSARAPGHGSAAPARRKRPSTVSAKRSSSAVAAPSLAARSRSYTSGRAEALPHMCCSRFFASLEAARAAASPLTRAGNVSSALIRAAWPSASARRPKVAANRWGLEAVTPGAKRCADSETSASTFAS